MELAAEDAVACLHLQVLRLGDHLYALALREVVELPLFKFGLEGSLLFHLHEFGNLHGRCAHLNRIRYGVLELSCDWDADEHLVLLRRAPLSAHRGLKEELIGHFVLLLLFRTLAECGLPRPGMHVLGEVRHRL